MAAFNKFNSFGANLANKKHNLAADQLMVALTNTIPTVGMVALTELTQIAYTNLSGATPRNITTISSSQTGGAYSLVLTDLTLTATGAVGPFQYVVLYNSAATGFELIGWYAYASAVTMANLETFLIDFAATTLTM